MRWIVSALILFVFVLAACSTGQTPSALEPTPAAATQIEQPAPTQAPPQMPTETALPAISLPDASGFQWVKVSEGLDRPLDLQHAGDTRLFVVEQRGLIWILENGERRPDPFLDIQQFVGSQANEQGLLGLAFHPEYVDNGQFFVNYTDRQGNTVIARFVVSEDPNLADPNSLRVILRFEQPYRNHNGGGMAFGPDGHLYIGTGDGGSADDPQGNGQSLDTLLGKILRIDVTSKDPYAIPGDNPFAGSAMPEIWAYGLRNPWRFSFDRANGDLYIADVGQNEWEEINFQPSASQGGVNYGWNIREAAHPFAGDGTEGLTDPVAEYNHSLGCSVTGGVVMRDPNLPEWDGVYLYGDYCTGLIWGLIQDASGMWLSDVLFNDTGFTISSFGEDASGSVYLMDHKGTIFRLERTP